MGLPLKDEGSVSVVVTTHEWPRALELCLASLARQSRLPDEVLVTDDGSGAATRRLLERVARDYPVRLVHLWQPHRGFRAARSRNRAIAAARGDYVLLLDGDMLAHRHFVADHLGAARRGCFTQGTRALAGAALSARLLREGRLDVRPFSAGLAARRHALRLPGPLAALLRRPRDYGRKTVMSCNQGYWREDLLALNGFDERMTGWGREDTELALRCYHAGLRRLPLRHCALAVHLHHAPRGHGDGPNPNDALLQETARLRRVRCDTGIGQHLAELVQRPPDLRHGDDAAPAREVRACA